jgi:hypothetical protein
MIDARRPANGEFWVSWRPAIAEMGSASLGGRAVSATGKGGLRNGEGRSPQRPMAGKFYRSRRGIAGLAVLALAFVLVGGGMIILLAGARAVDSLTILGGGLASLLAGLWLGALGRRMRTRTFNDLQSFERFVAECRRKLILFLREFSSDRMRDDTADDEFTLSSFFITEEQRICDVMKHYGTVVAVGRPGEKLPAAGSHRLYIADEDWRSVVGALLKRADLILMRCGDAPGVAWEMEQVMAPENRPKTVFLSSRDSKKNKLVYDRLTKLMSAHVPNLAPTLLRPMRFESGAGDEMAREAEALLQKYFRGRELFERQVSLASARLIRFRGSQPEPIHGTFREAFARIAADMGMKKGKSDLIKPIGALVLVFGGPLLLFAPYAICPLLPGELCPVVERSTVIAFLVMALLLIVIAPLMI